MKSFTAIFLASIILFTQTELHQLQKLPFMVQHFLQHNEMGMSLTQFIIHHYLSDDVQYPDHEQDMKLPFKSHERSQSTSLNIATTAKETTSFTVFVATGKNKFILYNERIPTARPSDIWQPPKLS